MKTIMSDGIKVYEEKIDFNNENNTIWLVNVLEKQKIPYFINFIKHTQGIQTPVTWNSAEIYVSQINCDYVVNCIKQYNENQVITTDFITG